jgi:hypothetical protein
VWDADPVDTSNRPSVIEWGCRHPWIKSEFSSDFESWFAICYPVHLRFLSQWSRFDSFHFHYSVCFRYLSAIHNTCFYLFSRGEQGLLMSLGDIPMGRSEW